MPEPKLHIITDTVALTITVGDRPPIRLEVARLAHEPHWTVLPIEPKSTEITRTDDGEEGYAAFDIKIGAGR